MKKIVWKRLFAVCALVAVAGVFAACNGAEVAQSPVPSGARESEPPGATETARPVAQAVKAVAQDYVREIAARLQQEDGLVIADSKVTKLTYLTCYTGLAQRLIELYAIEYRLKPQDAAAAKRQGLTVEDGWVTQQDPDRGNPLLAVERNGEKASFCTILFDFDKKYSEYTTRTEAQLRDRDEKRTVNFQMVKILLSEIEQTQRLLLSYCPAEYADHPWDAPAKMAYDVFEMDEYYRHLGYAYVDWLNGYHWDQLEDTALPAGDTLLLWDGDDRRFTFSPDSNLMHYTNGRESLYYKVTPIEEYTWDFGKKLLSECYRLEALPQNIAITVADGATFEDIAQQFMGAYIDRLTNDLLPGNPKRILDMVVEGIAVTRSQDDVDRFYFEANFYVKPIEESAATYWIAGPGREGTGEYEGYIWNIFRCYLQRTDGVWRFD